MKAGYGSVPERFPNTLKLAFWSIIVAMIISVPLGITAATHHRTWVDGVSMIASMIGVSMPTIDTLFS